MGLCLFAGVPCGLCGGIGLKGYIVVDERGGGGGDSSGFRNNKGIQVNSTYLLC